MEDDRKKIQEPFDPKNTPGPPQRNPDEEPKRAPGSDEEKPKDAIAATKRAITTTAATATASFSPTRRERLVLR